MRPGVAVLIGLLALQDAPKKPFVPSDQYETRTVAGWTVRVNKALLGAEADLGKRALRHLEFLLEDLERRVPPTACGELRKVTFWLGVDDWRAPEACYHPSAAWLKENGFNPDKAKGVEIGNAAAFLKQTRDQPMMVVHELAHAYHDQVLGFNHAAIREAYEKAKAAGTYESVLRINGSRERAYAIKNHHEYFAEATEAFFGANDFYPFVRPELKEHDPDLYRILKEVWK